MESDSYLSYKTSSLTQLHDSICTGLNADATLEGIVTNNYKLQGGTHIHLAFFLKNNH
jgi:hypothetical protein